MKKKVFLLAAVMTAFLCQGVKSQSGANDSTFNPVYQGFDPGTGADGSIRTIAIQSDGKILIGGGFTNYNASAINYIARLSSTGSLDATFIPGTGANNFVRKINIQTDGKILVCGDFTTFNGSSFNRIVRLTSTGSVDSGFNPGTGANVNIRTSAIKTDGKILIGGEFTLFNGTTRNYFARLNSDGSLDTTCVTCAGANDGVRSTAIQADGKIIIGGYYTFFNGSEINRIARLNSDGSLDDTFDPGMGADAGITSVALQSDGKILVAGDFTSFNGTALYRVARVNANGSLDATFLPDTGANNIVYALGLQSDGKILIAGDFDTVNGVARKHVARLNSNGTLDASFDPGSGTDFTVMDLKVQSNGKILIGGSFTTYNGSTANHIARLNSDGTLDASFDMGTGTDGSIRTITIQSDAKILIGGAFTTYNGTTRNRIARLNSDGTVDATFDPASGPASSVYSSAIQSDGKILIGGLFSTYNGTSVVRLARINSDGSLDGGFNPGTGANNVVYSISLQSDGRIIIGGIFTTYHSIARNRIARVIDVTIVGTPEYTRENDIELYPNPTGGQIVLSSENGLKHADIKLFDAGGRLIKTIKNISEAKCTIDISNQSDGLYFIEVIGQDNVTRLKVMKN